jgi:hypothetical protein
VISPLFTEVPRIEILRTSPFGHSPKFALTAFSEVVQEFIGNSSPMASMRPLCNVARLADAAKERRHK